jgi:hypothetical protein
MTHSIFSGNDDCSGQTLGGDNWLLCREITVVLTNWFTHPSFIAQFRNNASPYRTASERLPRNPVRRPVRLMVLA